jgi:hypothetical protein
MKNFIGMLSYAVIDILFNSANGIS